MFIFRVEHKRDICTSARFNQHSESLTGHGPHSGCVVSHPNFGSMGNAPSARMMEYERCAVTARQFSQWISPLNRCRNLTKFCQSERNCYYCPAIPTKPELEMIDGWHIVAYYIDDDKEGIDWRIDNNQVVFNPEFAQLIGPVEAYAIEDLASSPLM